MSYKFQLGLARLSGSLIQEGSITSDGTLKLDGVADATAAVADDSLYFLDSDGLVKRESFADYAATIAGSGLAASAGVLSVGVDDSSIEINSDALRVKAAGITGDMLNDDVISGQAELAQGGLAAADELMISDGGTIKKYGVDSLAKDALALTSEAALAVADDYIVFLDGGASGETKKEQFSDVVGNIAGDGLAAASGVLAVAVSGAVKIASDKVGISGSIAGAGLVGLGGADSISELAVDIGGLGALGGASIAQSDEFMFDDAGTLKKVTFSNLEDSIFGNISGDATIAAGGALTIGDGAVEEGMLNDNVISGQDELAAADIADADEFLISDGGTLKRVGVDSLQNHYYGNVSGDATIADGGALTIANNAVEAAMINTAVAGDGLTGGGGSALSVQVSGAIKIASDKLGLTGSFAGTGLQFLGGEDSISSIVVDIGGLGALGGATIAQGDEFMFDDSGTIKKVTFSNLEDSIFGNVSGDATVAAGGALTIANDAVQSAMLNDDIISGQTAITSGLAATDEFLLSDAGALKRMDVSVLGDFLGGGAGITVSSGELSVSAAQTSITSIINSGITKIGTDAAQEYVDFSTANEIHLTVNNAPALVATATGVTVEGNLTVLGTTTSIDSTTINISQSFTFEGPADAHETTLHCGTPIADTTINLPQLAAGTYHLPVIAGAATAASALVTAAEFALLDGGATQSTGVTLDQNADSFFYNDGGVMKHLRVKEVKSFMQGLTVQNIDDSGTCKVGINYFSALGGAESCTLPASSGLVAGDIVYVKAPSNCSDTNTITVNRAGSQTIDGVTAIVLESPFAAITLVYVDTDTFVIV